METSLGSIMRFPDFLIIGAMKAGTTSLCRDLETNSNISFSSVKEPHTLCLDDVLTEQGRQNYAALFRDSGPEQACGEGSTGYTKLPYHVGIPERARKLIGTKLKLIYIVREPVARTLSHHYHMYRAGDAPGDIDQAVRSISQLVEVSRYAMQLQPWIDVFGLDHVCVVRFEDYVQDRGRTVAQLCEFLGVEFEEGAINPKRVHNAGYEQLLPPDMLRDTIRKITRSQWYKRNVHPRVPQWVRDQFKSAFYEEAKERPDSPSIQTIDYIIDRVSGDVRRLSEMIGRQEPLWNMESVRSSWATRRDIPQEET